MDSPFSEHDFLTWLRTLPADPRLSVPIGDDAAVMKGEGGQILLATDTVVEGTHCVSDENAAVVLARKVVRSNLSDIAAMGGRPEALLLSMVLPRESASGISERIVRTVFEECQRFKIALAGGDTVCAGDQIVLTAAVTGRPCAEPITRGGARLGDLIVVTGEFGGSILGHHADFEPRIQEAASLVACGPPTAMADVSDGLLRDLANICAASGLGACIRADDVPVSEAAALLAAGTEGLSALDCALHDGEDFELLFTMSEERLRAVRQNWNIDTMLTVIGEMVETGLWLERHGVRKPVDPGGWDHGAGRGETDHG